MTGRVYPCKHCDETFTNAPKLGGHVHANHPEHRRDPAKHIARPLIQARGPRPGGSLKRETDYYPARP